MADRGLPEQMITLTVKEINELAVYLRSLQTKK